MALITPAQQSYTDICDYREELVLSLLYEQEEAVKSMYTESTEKYKKYYDKKFILLS